MDLGTSFVFIRITHLPVVRDSNWIIKKPFIFVSTYFERFELEDFLIRYDLLGSSHNNKVRYVLNRLVTVFRSESR